MRIFGREPALWLSLLGTAVKLIAAFWIDLNTTQQSALNAIVAAAIGIWVATLTKDGISAAILGLAQALLALALGFGFHIDADNQAVVMSFVATVAAMFVRTQATAPVPYTRAP